MFQRRAALRAERMVKACDFRHAADADAVAQPGDRDFVGFVHHSRNRRARFIHDRHGDRIALHRVNRQTHPQWRDQLRRIAAHRHDKGVSGQAPGAGADRDNAVAIAFQPGDIDAIAEGDARRRGHVGQRIGELEAVAGLVPRQAQTARDLATRGGKARLGGDAAVSIQNLERDAIGAQNGDVLGRGLDLFFGAEQLQRALGAFVIADAGFFAQRHQAIARIFGQPHHAGFVHRIGVRGAVRQHPRQPAQFRQVRARLQDQRRMFHEHPLDRLDRNARCGPGGGIAGADLAGIGKAGFQRRPRLTVDHRHLMPCAGQIPGRRNADDPCPQNHNLHAGLLFADRIRIGRRAEISWRSSAPRALKTEASSNTEGIDARISRQGQIMPKDRAESKRPRRGAGAFRFGSRPGLSLRRLRPFSRGRFRPRFPGRPSSCPDGPCRVRQSPAA